MPERTLIKILARTAYWLGRWRHFGPASGKDPKLKDPQGRYVLTTFACGSNMGQAEAARHIAGITAHEISLAKNRHVTLTKLNKAIAEVVNAAARRRRHRGLHGRSRLAELPLHGVHADV